MLKTSIKVLTRVMPIMVCLCLGSSAAWSQTTGTGGTLIVAVSDPSGAIIPAASLEVKDPATNDIRRAVTQANGIYSFLNLPGGTYSLTVTAQGFANSVFQSVQIKTGLETEVKVILKVGTATESVTVTATETPLVQTEASTISTNIDTKQIFTLPQLSRDVFSLVYTVPGYAGNSFNNLPTAAIISATVDGTQAKSNRFRDSTNYGQSNVQLRMENIAEFTVTTAQLDLSGNGSSAMGITAVYKRGSNNFHGLVYEDFRNTVLNANSWANNATVNAQGVGTPRTITKYNQFGGTISGPIKRNKLFFFGNWSMLKQPNTTTATATLLNPLAQQGIYQFINTAGGITQVNLFQLAASAGLPSSVNPTIQSQLTKINSILGKGNITPNASDPNVSTLSWANASTTTQYFPSVRLDYNMTDKLRFSTTYTEQLNSSPQNYAPNFPGGIDPIDNSSSRSNSDIVGLNVEYSPTVNLFNNLHLGYMYEFSSFSPENLGLDYSQIHNESWGLGTGLYTGNFPRRAITSLYSQYSINDSMTWQHGKHTIQGGFSGFREWDRYWNGAGGDSRYTLGLNSADPAYTTLTNAIAALPNGGNNTTFQAAARSLYSTLVGAISSVGINVGRPVDTKTRQYKPYGQFNLNEVQQSMGWWIQDRWRLRPSLTLNYGLRWDVVGDDYNKGGFYTSARSVADIWGPTPIGAQFQPGKLGGVDVPTFQAAEHKYNTMWKNPQPAIGIAWNPSADSGLLGKLLGRNKTVIRTGYSLRNYQDGAQNIWAFGTDGGGFFYQSGSYNPDSTLFGNPGYYKPGTLFMNDPLPVPNFLLRPGTYSSTVTADQLFGSSEWAINPNIRTPYVQSWNFGIQRELPGGQAIEIDYVGNLTLHTWLGLNINEVNIYENGFLDEFKKGQANMAINQANGRGATPFNFGLAGQSPLPIMTAAYGNTNNANWTGQATNFTNGAAASVASNILGSAGFLCNIIGGAKFKPCADNGVTGAGAYPLNFFNINPYARTAGLNYLDSAGMSNYNSLQVQYRKRLTHGAQFTANYTFSHSMYNGVSNDLQSQGYAPHTLRDLSLNYTNSPNDIRHVLRVFGTYDLPFGKGRKFANRGAVLDRIVGGWTIGTLTSIQTAPPTVFSGGYNTVNTNGTSGINFLQGMTAEKFQDNIKLQNTGQCTATGCNGWVQEFGSLVTAGGTADPAYFTPGTTPGAFSTWTTIRGPLTWTSNASATKAIRIHENYVFTLQATANNVFNHPTIGLGNLNILGTTFGRATPGGNRSMALRANLTF